MIHRPYYTKPSRLLSLLNTAQSCFQGPLCCITSACCFDPAIKASPYMHTLKGFRRCKSWFGGFFVYLFLNAKLSKFRNCFLILTFYFQQGKSKSPQYKVIAIQSIHWIRFPSRFLIFQGWKERFPLGPANEPSIMWMQCMHIHSITNLSLLEWLWHGYHESILSYSPIFIVNSTEIRWCLPPVSNLNGRLTALPLKHKLCVPRH